MAGNDHPDQQHAQRQQPAGRPRHRIHDCQNTKCNAAACIQQQKGSSNDSAELHFLFTRQIVDTMRDCVKSRVSMHRWVDTSVLQKRTGKIQMEETHLLA